MGDEQRYQVEVLNQQDSVACDLSLLQQVVRSVLEQERVLWAAVSLVVVDNSTIHDLNRQFLDHDEPTDVLSFLLECEPAERAQSAGGEGKRLEGEVIVSAEMAAQRAGEFGWRPCDELVLYVVHGVLHLCGYDDRTAEAQQLMRARERSILKNWDLTPRYDASPVSKRGEEDALETGR